MLQMHSRLSAGALKQHRSTQEFPASCGLCWQDRHSRKRAALSSWNAPLASRARGCCISRGWRAGEQRRGGLERSLQGSAEPGPQNKTRSLLLLLWLLAPTAPVFAVCLLEHVFAGNFGLQFGADQERAAHLPMKRVGLLWRGDEPMLQHDWD